MAATHPKRITVIHCWSAPRSRSTALLYSFEARGSECAALDEPLYREWLIRRGDAVARPYRHELIHGIPPPGSSGNEAAAWRRELLSLEDRIRTVAELLPDKGVIFCKHMAKHAFLYDFEKEFIAEDLNVELIHKHLLLIRDPVAVLSSWGVSESVHGNNATPDEVGIVPLLSIYSSINSRPAEGRDRVVLLDSDNLVNDPEGVLITVCEDLGISYNNAMMSWPQGPHFCDGV
jgi:protein-lysine N-methyltransferase EEF2KMT